MDLNTIWFLLIGVLFIGYGILDGFDLGVGILHPLSRGDTQRRTMMNAIGPVWDGNEVWLVTGGGAMFAAFPEVYATLFSAFYVPFMLLLLALILRAVSMEFRSKQENATWRMVWDFCFFLGSFLAATLCGALVGNLAWGMPLDANHEYTGGLLDLLKPYALLVAVSSVALLTLHGALYMILKADGELQDRARGWATKAFFAFAALYVVTTVCTIIFVPRMIQPMRDHPMWWILPALTVLAIANIPRELHLKNDFRAFLTSCVTITLLLGTLFVGLFPNIIVSTTPGNSLDIHNAASSQGTLKIMLIIAIIGMPLVLAYTTTIYWVFRGKVKLEPTSY